MVLMIHSYRKAHRRIVLQSKAAADKICAKFYTRSVDLHENS